MILNAEMRLPDYKKFSYIIMKDNTRIVGTYEDLPTISEVKSVAGRTLSSVSIPRMQHLKECIISATKTYEALTSNLIIPLSEPCHIGGQSDYNQQGYGSYAARTYYGEMTGFVVIGIRINRPEYY